MASHPINVAVLDDYQGKALKLVDWSKVSDRANIVVFQDHLADRDAVAERLAPFDVICIMRERTPLPGALLNRLPKLKLIASTGPPERFDRSGRSCGTRHHHRAHRLYVRADHRTNVGAHPR